MTTSLLLLALLALLVGALVPLQAAATAMLSKSLEDNVAMAALTMFVVAALTALLAVVLTGARIPSAAAWRMGPVWAYAGGVFGAIFILTLTFLAPRLGVGTAVSWLVTGQILGALVVDHLGLLRSPVFAVTPLRLAGASLMIVGLFLALRR
jgi:transporter family-2 protein